MKTTNGEQRKRDDRSENRINAYLTLQNIRPAQNRYRSYVVKIETLDIRNNRSYIVKLAWGRIGGNKRIHFYVCNNPNEVKSLLRPVLRTRLRHGYRLINKSENFPRFEILNEFQVGSIPDTNQLLLFREGCF